MEDEMITLTMDIKKSDLEMFIAVANQMAQAGQSALEEHEASSKSNMVENPKPNEKLSPGEQAQVSDLLGAMGQQ